MFNQRRFRRFSHLLLSTHNKVINYAHQTSSKTYVFTPGALKTSGITFRMLPKSFRLSSNLIVSVVFIVFHVYNLCDECRTVNCIIFRLQLQAICTKNNCSVEIPLFTFPKLFTQNTCSLEMCPTLRINVGMEILNYQLLTLRLYYLPTRCIKIKRHFCSIVKINIYIGRFYN